MARILIVDDEKSIRNTFEVFLKNENHEVSLAENAEIALELIKCNQYDLMFTDIVMPKITGIELLEKVKDIYADLPIIIMTGEPTIDTAKKAIQWGAVDYLVKPVSKDALLKTVRFALDRVEYEKKNNENQKKQEKLLEEITQSLEVNKKIVELSPTPMMIVDVNDNDIVYLNRAMSDFVKANEFKNFIHSDFFDTEEESDKVKKAFIDKRRIDNMEVRIRRSGTGEVVWCLLSIHPIMMKGKRCLIISFTNLNDIIEAKAQMEIARQKAEEATKAKSEFLANMSHEIRTPMNAIIGLSELLYNTELSEKQRDYIDKLNISAKNLMGIINDVLDISKLEAGKLNLEMIEFDLDKVLGNLETIASFSANEKGLEFILDRKDNVKSMLIGDPLRLGQVLLNLTNNAIKFTDNGKITVSTQKLNETKNSVQLLFSVVDTGIGITKENQKKLFNNFAQADSSITRRYGGSGLGLAICKSIVNFMGGEIGVKSEYGVGSTFYFECTIRKANVKGKESKLIKEQAESDTNKRNIEKLSKHCNKKILLVEDNEINQLVTQDMLSTFGFELDIAENGKVAVEKSLVTLYELILMDLQMPIMDGYTAAEEIRKHNKEVPIVALSAETMGNIKEKIYNAGMNEYLSKPINNKQLEATLVKWLCTE